MRKLLIIFTIAIAWTIGFVSCIQSSQNRTKNVDKPSRPQVFVKLSTTTGVNEKQITKDSNYVIENDYFEVGLYSVGQGKSYIAEKEIEEPRSIENFKSVTLYIVDSTQNPISFKSSTEFLNYMSERGYEMVDQEKLKYHTDYTFKRK
jgi:hypothetical protein